MTATEISNLDTITDTLCRELLQDDRDLGEILFSVEVREVVPDGRDKAVETLQP